MKLPGQINHILHHQRGSRVGHNVEGKDLIDFDNLRIKLLDVAVVRVAGTKIIQRKLNADTPEFVRHR